ncbi:MAG: NAD(P)-dependent dehydrogenase (short-subunit alcohol dehydrogenase family) [Hyphomicrobiaceae bacterium]|jgi:NAD(P)-dependent dehydrogenase (short-subunit alcohol dehydrogenase family)
MADNLGLAGRVAVVTGAGGGLGRSHALLFAKHGAKVVVNDLGGSADGTGDGSTMAEKVVQEIKDAGGEAVPNFDSVSTPEGGANIIKTAIDAFGKIDILVNNAGILRDKSFTKMTDDDWDLVQAVHVKGAYYCTKAAWPHMREQNYGRIIMTASASGIYGNFGQSNYSVAKMGLVGFGQTLALEGDKYNVKTNIIAPVAASRMTESLMPPNILEKLRPECVSPVVVYLCSENIDVNGELYEVGAGAVSRIESLRSVGTTLNPDDGFGVEEIAANWEKINDMTDAKIVRSIGDSTTLTLTHCLS